MSNRPWTPAEFEVVRAEYRKTPSREIARRLGRSVGAVRQAAIRLGVHRTQCPIVAAQAKRFRELYDAGHTDAEIALDTGCCRKRIAGWRYDNRLPVREDVMRRVRRAANQKQFERLGIKSRYDLRRAAWARVATSRGLPADLTPRMVQIVVFLVRGPANKQQIAAAIGMKYTSGRSRSSMKNSRNGSYLGDLANRGLVFAHRVNTGTRGGHYSLYSLTPRTLAMLASAPGKAVS